MARCACEQARPLAEFYRQAERQRLARLTQVDPAAATACGIGGACCRAGEVRAKASSDPRPRPRRLEPRRRPEMAVTGADPANPTSWRALARDGTPVRLRPLRRDERELVARFFAGLSAESRRRRFLQPMPRLPEALLRRLVDVDGRRHVAVVATTVDGECAGIASWIALADEPGAAEVAVTVTDCYQGRGIGRLLVDALRLAAVRAGLTTLVYVVDPTNRPALRLLRSLDGELAFRDGLVQGRQRLPGRPLMEHRTARVWHPPDGLVGLGHPHGQLLEGPGDMQPPGGVTQAASQLAVDAGARAIVQAPRLDLVGGLLVTRAGVEDVGNPP
jgi:ribosomal protein S18 acetylase RimI-like enzyme